MHQSTKFRVAFAAIAASTGLIGAPAAMAGSAAGTAFNVQVTITSGCTISNDAVAVDFGQVVGTSAKPTAKTKTATITCSSGVPYDFHVTSTNGLKMKSAAGNLIPYTIKAGSSTTALGTTTVTSGFTQTGNGAAQTVTFTFDIASWNAASPYADAVYTDTATLSVDF